MMHEFVHKYLDKHPEQFGPRNKYDKDNLGKISPERLNLVEEKLGFKLVGGDWLIQGKNENGARTWYKDYIGTLSGWIRCNGKGEFTNPPTLLTPEQTEALAKERGFPTAYFSNPEELICDSLPYLWLGGKAREKLAIECPAVYELAMAEDLQLIKELPDDLEIIKTLKATHPDKLIVRGLDGHLTIDNEQYQKQLAEFNKRVASARRRLPTG